MGSDMPGNFMPQGIRLCNFKRVVRKVLLRRWLLCQEEGRERAMDIEGKTKRSQHPSSPDSLPPFPFYFSKSLLTTEHILYFALCVPLIKMYAHTGERFLFVLFTAVSLALGSGGWQA